MTIGEHKIKISGTACVDQPLKIGSIYDLTLSEVECRSIETFTNDDGTEDKISKIKLTPHTVMNAINEKEFIIGKAKKGSQSQKLRAIIHELYYQNSNNDEEFESFYCRIMSEIIENERAKLL